MRKLRAIANYAKGLNMHGADPEIFDCVEDKMKWHKFEPRTVSKRRESIGQSDNPDT